MQIKILLLALVLMLSTWNSYSQSNIDVFKSLSNLELIKEGNQVFEIKLPSVTDKLVDLNDYRGKYIFLDIWATWCGPCIKNMPYIEGLIERYKEKNIAFFKISVDDSKEKWKNYIHENSLKGEHLFANGLQTKPICYFIYRVYEENGTITQMERGVPRYILIDPNGIIIKNDLEKMSQDNLTEYLAELLK